MPPETLYHYTSNAGFIGIVSKKKLWATSIRHMNDATEYLYAHDMVVQALNLEAVRARSVVIRALVRDLASDVDGRRLELPQVLAAQFGHNFVVSLSEGRDQLSQWRAYCPRGGYSLGFSSAALAVIGQANGFDLVQCVYDRDANARVAATIAATVVQSLSELPHDALVDVLEEGGEISADAQQRIWPIRAKMIESILEVAPRWKNPAFAEEREWRLVSRAQPREILFREGRRSIVPYVEVNLDVPGTQADDYCAVLSHTMPAPTPEPDLAVSTAVLLLQQHKVARADLGWSSVPYREW